MAGERDKEWEGGRRDGTIKMITRGRKKEGHKRAKEREAERKGSINKEEGEKEL